MPDLSPPSSPVRKRQRLSSPTYDGQLADLSQDDLAAYDELEYRLSQSSQISQSKLGPDNNTRSAKSAAPQDSKTFGLSDDSENPFNVSFTSAKSANVGFAKASAIPLGFSKASALHDEASHDTGDYERSPSPEVPAEQDFSAWFAPASSVAPVGFQSASASASSSSQTPIGFTKASNKGFIVPSTVALANARAKMKRIWTELDSENASSSSTSASTSARPIDPADEDRENAHLSAPTAPPQSSPRRLALRAVENSPGTPTPAGFTRPALQNTLISTPATESFLKKYAKPFKSPLMSKHIATPSSTIGRHGNSKLPLFSTAREYNQLSTPTPAAASPSTPLRPVATPSETPFVNKVQRPFVTPFKQGVKPGILAVRRAEQMAAAIQSKPVTPMVGKAKNTPFPSKSSEILRESPVGTGVFDLQEPPNRKTLASSGLLPQQHTYNQLFSMGINIKELSQITPTLALYYVFHTESNASAITPSSTYPVVLGPSRAFEELLSRGCSLATKPWVDNHWGLILWKLAGMVALDPETESSDKRRWSWAEVIRQLMYRYEREINCGKRPALRLIATQDAPAGYPMVLCVFNITWSDSSSADDDTPPPSHPELEVTDGWYRLKAQVDAPIARAIRRGVIRIGMKIGVAGARLFSEKKEPSEILDAYNSTKLIISGNSSHLAPWHAKLGFRTGPCISTLHSLTNDGGSVAAMDIVIVRAHPIAFLEFFEDEDGKRRSIGPRNQAEEAAAQDQWKKRWEMEMSKLRQDLEKKWSRYEGYMDRLERKMGRFNPSEDVDFPPDLIERFYDELEDPIEALRVLRDLSGSDAGWLARRIRDGITKERERAHEDLENEVKHLCPPRQVRNFRVIIIEDACTQRRAANRKAQLTVWDVLNLSFSEGSAAGSFGVGERFMVTNLIPTQISAWMNCEPGSEVFLATRRDSRWTPIRTPRP